MRVSYAFVTGSPVSDSTLKLLEKKIQEGFIPIREIVLDTKAYGPILCQWFKREVD